MIYLDNAATTPLLPEVAQEMFEISLSVMGNPSSIHTAGRAAAKLIRQAREDIANLLHVPSDHLIFTSGGSEANTQALLGYALANRDKGKHLVTTAIEHHSVLNTFAYLRDRHQFDITIIQPDSDGNYTADMVLDAVKEDTILVSIMYANNETGQVLPISEIGNALKTHKAVYHVDAVQVMGKLPIQPLDLGIDLLSASAHKFHGPKGVGFLYYNNVRLDPLIHGGEQENKKRAGTENIPGIIGMAKALSLAYHDMTDNYQKVTALKAHLLAQLTGLTYYLNQFGTKTMPHVINIGFPGVNHNLLLMKLDLQGVAISTGSACTAGDIAPSHVLEACYGPNSPKLKESVRISFSDLTTATEIDNFIEILTNILSHT